MLGRPAGICALVVASVGKIAAAPGFIISVLNGSHWKQLRMRRQVTNFWTWRQTPCATFLVLYVFMFFRGYLCLYTKAQPEHVT